MPLGTPYHTLSDIIINTKRQFGDESGVQITDADITRWANAAQMEIVSKNPMIQAKAVQVAVPSQQTYSVPPNLIQIESVMYDGNILEPRNFEGVRTELGNENTGTGVPCLWYTWANELYLWPVPNSALAIQVNYSATPTVMVSANDLISVPDRYFDRICEYVNSKAYELDEDWTANANQRQNFEDKLMEANNAQVSMNGAYFVATDPDGDWY